MSKQKSSIAAIALLADFTIVLVITNFLLDLYHGVGTEYILAFPCIIVFMLYVLGIYRPLLVEHGVICLLYTSPSPRDQRGSRMPSSA